VATEKYGLDASQTILPAEHILLAEPKILPAIAIVDGPPGSDMIDFVLLWKVDGDRVQIMDPVLGRTWIPRADLAKRIYVHEMTIPAEDWHAAESQPSFQDAVRARLVARGLDREAAQALVARAAADPNSRALGVLEAATRQLESDPAAAGGDARAFVTTAVDCALDSACADPVPASFRSARPAPKDADGRAQVEVRGALLLVIAGRKPPSP
jgi:ATP-binding cassette subfamily B protein